MMHDARSGDDRRPALTRDDARAMDRMLPPEAAERVAREQQAQPARARTVREVREALDLWAAEARDQARRVDPEALAARVLAAPAPTAAVPAPWGYAAAAAALLTVSVTGLALRRPAVRAPSGPTVALDLEQETLAVLRRIELERLPLPEGR